MEALILKIYRIFSNKMDDTAALFCFVNNTSPFHAARALFCFLEFFNGYNLKIFLFSKNHSHLENFLLRNTIKDSTNTIFHSETLCLGYTPTGLYHRNIYNTRTSPLFLPISTKE